MTINTHIAELKQRHHGLENAIAEAFADRSTEDFKITELKRQKLKLKDEIERLQQERKRRELEASRQQNL